MSVFSTFRDTSDKKIQYITNSLDDIFRTSNCVSQMSVSAYYTRNVLICENVVPCYSKDEYQSDPAKIIESYISHKAIVDGLIYFLRNRVKVTWDNYNECIDSVIRYEGNERVIYHNEVYENGCCKLEVMKDYIIDI